MEKIINVGGRLHNPVVGGAVTGADEIKDDLKGKMQSVINQETDAEMVRLDGAKQDKLTFDQTPTENSTNPVTSGGVYAADAALQQAIEAILLLIPSAASALNQLADKSFVNSSIATSTATFRGTYNVVADLGLTIDATHQQIAEALGADISTADNNDYCYVQVPIDSESSDIRRTERYKFNGTAWSYEYDLNTSGYTASQWAAINSGITAALVGDLNDIKSYIPAEATALNKLADMAYVLAQIIANIPAFKGQFTTLSDLQAVQSPKAGDCGIVRTKDNDGQDVFTFYQYLNGSWNVYYVLSRHPQRKPVSTGVNGDYPFNGMGLIELPMNMREGWMNDTWLYYPVNGIVYLLYSWNFQLYAVYSNGEGLGLENNVVVKPANYNISDIADIVANRYLPFTEDGGVYTITKPNSSTITSTDLNNTTIVNYNDPSYKGVNVLTQDMMSAANTKYVIKYDYELGEDITIPANCILEFDGGSIKRGNIYGNKTQIDADRTDIFGKGTTLKGAWDIDELYPEWFGAVGDGETDDAESFRRAFYFSNYFRIPIILSRFYYIAQTVAKPSMISKYLSVEIISRQDGLPVEAHGVYGNPIGFKMAEGVYLIEDYADYVENVGVNGLKVRFSNILISNGDDSISASYKSGGVFKRCNLMSSVIENCNISNIGNVFYNTMLRVNTLISNNRFTRIHEFCHCDNDREYWCIDAIIQGNYISGYTGYYDGGTHQDDVSNNCFEWNEYNGSIITDNFIEFYICIFKPSIYSGSVREIIINSIGNQYQGYKYLYYVPDNVRYIAQFNGDTFNHTNSNKVTVMPSIKDGNNNDVAQNTIYIGGSKCQVSFISCAFLDGIDRTKLVLYTRGLDNFRDSVEIKGTRMYGTSNYILSISPQRTDFEVGNALGIKEIDIDMYIYGNKTLFEDVSNHYLPGELMLYNDLMYKRVAIPYVGFFWKVLEPHKVSRGNNSTMTGLLQRLTIADNGLIYHNTADSKDYLWNGTAWVDATGTPV